MNKAFKTRQLNFLFQILVLSAVVFGIHGYLLSYFGTELKLFFPIWQIYVFHLGVTTLFYSVINYRFSQGQTDIFVLFMACTLTKMMLAILFLLPLILSDFEKKQPDIFNFFIPYFIYLGFEVYSITKFLQKS
ncbi:MAG TPA: hypothetical protein VNJ50_13955 [Gelidibacter sp.]|uniref:hypothetical protein n=1 Tax=Gelidibacter sp. TaxID=2018083 RepID=UPI002CAD9D87|nr:hypothetical protein [Gelidibacter sp.]HXJ99953.1 hypothetical protein [Gelidibacter sp.]